MLRIIGAVLLFVVFGPGAQRCETRSRILQDVRSRLRRSGQVSIQRLAKKAEVNRYLSPRGMDRERFGKGIANHDRFLWRGRKLCDLGFVTLKLFELLGCVERRTAQGASRNSAASQRGPKAIIFGPQ